MMSRDAFASSYAIQRWIEAATLARGFALYVLVSPAPLETRLAIAALADALALQPHDVRTLDAFPPELEVTEQFANQGTLAKVLAPLVRPDRPARLVVLQLAPLPFLQSWLGTSDVLWLLGRLNEQRNLIASANPCPLALVVDRDVEILLVRGAPDLWSVRSGTYVLDSIERPGAEGWLPSTGNVLREPLAWLWPGVASEEVIRWFAEVVDAFEQGGAAAALSRLEAVDEGHPELGSPVVRAAFVLATLLLEGDSGGWFAIQARFDGFVAFWADVKSGATGTDDFLSEASPYVLWTSGLVAARAGNRDAALRYLNDGLGRFWGYWAGGILYRAIPPLFDRIVLAARANVAAGSLAEGQRWASWGYVLLHQEWLSPGFDESSVEPHSPPAVSFDALADVLDMLGDEGRSAHLRRLRDGVAVPRS